MPRNIRHSHLYHGVGVKGSFPSDLYPRCYDFLPCVVRLLISGHNKVCGQVVWADTVFALDVSAGKSLPSSHLSPVTLTCSAF